MESHTNNGRERAYLDLLVTSCDAKDDKPAHGHEIPVRQPLEALGCVAVVHRDGRNIYAIADEEREFWADTVARSRIPKSAWGGALTRSRRAARSPLGADCQPARRRSPYCR